MLSLLHKISIITLISIYCVVSSETGARSSKSEPTKSPFRHSVQILLKNTGEYPYIASVELDEKHICGGAIITDDCVLTAAHCIEFIKPERLKIRVGHTFKYENSENIQIRSVNYYETHPNFDGSDYDIAIIKTLKLFYFDRYVQPILLPRENVVYNGENGTVLGWGKTRIQRFGKYLKRVKLNIIHNVECAERRNGAVSETSICAHDRKHQQRECLADSGDPLVLHDPKNSSLDVLVGIVSRSSKDEDRCLAQFPIVLSNIGYLRPWILSKLNTGITEIFAGPNFKSVLPNIEKLVERYFQSFRSWFKKALIANFDNVV